MENILQKIFTHYLSDDDLNKKEKTTKNISGIKKVHYQTQRNKKGVHVNGKFNGFKLKDKGVAEMNPN